MTWLEVLNALGMVAIIMLLTLAVSEGRCVCGGELRRCDMCGGSECLRCGEHREPRP